MWQGILKTMEIWFYSFVGRKIYTGYIMSDSYLGMDQQYEICFNITSKALTAAPPGFFSVKEDYE